MTLTIELPEDIYQALQLEAEHHNMTAEERVQLLVERVHRYRAAHPRQEAAAKLDALVEQGKTLPLRDLLTTGVKHG